MKKSVLCILFLAISVSSLIGCNSKEATINNKDSNIVSSDEQKDGVSSNEQTDGTKEEELQVSDMSAKLVNTYKTIDEINNDSTLAVMGTVIHNEYLDYGGLTFTLSEFKVDKVIKGNMKNGDTIKVLQSGGISEVKYNEADAKSFEDPKEVENYLKDKIGKNFETTIEGVKVLKEDTNAILLLEEYDGPIVEDAYVGTGDFQGRFILNQNQKTKSTTPEITPQSTLLTETVTFDDLINLK